MRRGCETRANLMLFWLEERVAPGLEKIWGLWPTISDGFRLGVGHLASAFPVGEMLQRPGQEPAALCGKPDFCVTYRSSSSPPDFAV